MVVASGTNSFAKEMAIRKRIASLCVFLLFPPLPGKGSWFFWLPRAQNTNSAYNLGNVVGNKYWVLVINGKYDLLLTFIRFLGKYWVLVIIEKYD